MLKCPINPVEVDREIVASPLNMSSLSFLRVDYHPVFQNSLTAWCPLVSYWKLASSGLLIQFSAFRLFLRFNIFIIRHSPLDIRQ